MVIWISPGIILLLVLIFLFPLAAVVIAPFFLIMMFACLFTQQQVQEKKEEQPIVSVEWTREQQLKQQEFDIKLRNIQIQAYHERLTKINEEN